MNTFGIIEHNLLKHRRAAATNDPRRLPGVDMRSSRGRRFRDLVEALALEFGTADTARLRELASLKFNLEQLQALVVGGDSTASSDLVRLSNLITRREKEMRRIKASSVMPSAPSSLLERLVARHHTPKRSTTDRLQGHEPPALDEGQK
jgi:hypothetical protein